MLALPMLSPMLAQGPATSIFYGMDGNHRAVLILLGMLAIATVMIALGAFLMSTVNAMHRRMQDQQFKRELLDRGMGVDEIARLAEQPEEPTSMDRWLWGPFCGKR